jgi:hypothetical protein
MNRPPIIEMIRRLEVASVEGDWAALARVDADVAAMLAGMTVRRAAGAAERAALERLQSAHRAAARRCDDARVEVEARLGQMTRNREGWMAYALNDAREKGTA